MVWTCGARRGLDFGGAELNLVAREGVGGSWDEVMGNDRGGLGVGSAGPRGRAEWRGRLRGRLVKKPNPR